MTKRTKKKIKKKLLRKMKGGKQKKSQKEQVYNNIYSKSELKDKVKKSKKMKDTINMQYIKQIIPTMNKLEKQLTEQVKTFNRLNKLLGEYFTQ